MEDLMAGLAPYFGQISYVVRDMESSIPWFRQVFGVKYFGVHEFDLGPEMKVKVNGSPGQFRIKLALAYYGARGELELELIQPLSGIGPHMEHLNNHGPGLHHVAFFVPDFDQWAKKFIDSGCKIALEGQTPDIHFAYFDCRAHQGAFVELTQFTAAGLEGNNLLKEPPR